MKTIQFILFIILLFSHSAFAHRVGLFCYLEKGVLYGEGYFGKGDPVKNAEIKVYDTRNNELIAETITDNKGEFSLPLKKGVKEIKVVLSASMGHRAEYILKSEETEADDETYSKELNKFKKNYFKPRLPSIIVGISCIAGIFYLLYLLRRRNAS